MDSITITKEEFIEFVTSGYPLDMTKAELDEVYSAFTFYVNMDHNSFETTLVDDGVIVYLSLIHI